jgi:cytochrome c556
MRAASMAALQAAKARDREKAIDLTNQIADACATCHEIYRDTGDANSPARCTP